MRVADYIVDFLVKNGIQNIFLVTWGWNMFLIDGIAKNPHINPICNHHEQACAMWAVWYSKVHNSVWVAYTTTWCASTNAITWLLDAWQDNTPVIFISWQVKIKDTVWYYPELPLRQVWVQEADIISIVSPITKYSVMVKNPNDIAYHLEKALYFAKNWRQWPVWLDIPMDIQSSIIDKNTLKHYSPDEDDIIKEKCETTEFAELQKLINESKRPIIIAWNGIKLAKIEEKFRKFVNKVQIPVVETYLWIWAINSDNSLSIWTIGIKGSRAWNFAMQNADLVLVLWSRLSVSSVGFDSKNFARDAKIAVIDIDTYEHKKNTIHIDYIIHANLKYAIDDLLTLDKKKWIEDWKQVCEKWKNIFPVCIDSYKKDPNEKVNLYSFIDDLNTFTKDDAIIVSDAGSSFYVTSQAIHIRKKQRYITSWWQADMWFTIPAAIWACFANNKKEVIGITWDGSFQMNIQELQTIVHYNLPVKLFVWNNNGYLSIRATQRKFFDWRELWTDKSNGVSFPEIEKIAYAYGIKYIKISNNSELSKWIEESLSYKWPILCEVICIENQEIVPAVHSIKKDDGTMVSKPLEDMYPFLDRKTFSENMIIEAIKE